MRPIKQERSVIIVLIVLICITAGELRSSNITYSAITGRGWTHGACDESQSYYRWVWSRQDAERLPSDVTHLRICQALDDYEFLGQFHQLTHLNLKSPPRERMSVLGNCKNIRVLSVVFMDNDIVAEMPVMESVEEVFLSGAGVAAACAMLATKFPVVQRITLDMTGLIASEHLEAFRKLPRLRALYIHKYTTTEHGMQNIAQVTSDEVEACAKLPNLQELWLEGRDGDSPSGSSLAKLGALTNLRALHLIFGGRIITEALKGIPVGLDTLSVVGEATEEDVTALLKQVGRFTDLRDLSFSGVSISAQALEQLSRSNSKIERLYYSGRWPRNAAQCFKRFTALKCLRIDVGRPDCQLSPSALQVVADTLEEVFLWGKNTGSDWVAALADATHLTRLALINIAFKPEDNASVEKVMQRLEYATFHMCTGLRTAGYPVLSALKNVKYLQLLHFNESYSGSYAKTVASLPKITHLNVDCSATDEVAIGALAMMKRLTSLTMSYQSNITTPVLFSRLRGAESLEHLQIWPFAAWTRKEYDALQEVLPGVNLQIPAMK